MNENVCRLCLANNNLTNLSPIFKDLDQNGEYSRVLQLTTGLKITLNDGLPQHICKICTDLVTLALSLRNQSQSAEKKLKQINNIIDFSDDDISELTQATDFKWPVLKIEPTKITDLNLGQNPNFKSIKNKLSSECHTDLEKKKLKKQMKSKDKEAKVKHKLPVSEKKMSELKSKKALAGGEQPEMSKKAKRAMYMELVEGVFDPKGPVKCKVCKKTVSKWACFVSHAKLHLGFKFVCEFCGKSFISSTQLTRHCRSWHGLPRRLRCRQCSYLALDQPQLLLHERREHTGERPFVCDACGARFRSRRCLLQHLESHRTARDVQCPDCGALVKSRRHLARHRYSAHRRRRDNHVTAILSNG